MLLMQLSDDVCVPPPVTLRGLMVHDRLVEFSVTESVTVPEKPFTGVTVIVEPPATLTLVIKSVGLAVTVKF
jgi:hypothetical protein